MAVIATLAVKLVADARELQEGLTKASGRLKDFGSKATAAGKSLTTNLTLPIAALGAASIKMASDAEEAASKFGVVFGSQADDVRMRLEALTETIPVTTTELLGMSAGIQDLLVPLGIAPEAAAQMTEQVVRLAGDLASFNNIPVAEALDKIRAGLVGSNEPLLDFGVAINAAMVESEALRLGLISQGDEMTAAARAAASFNLVLQGTTAAHGDAARTAESSANSFKFMWTAVKNLAETMGKELLPVVTPVVQRITELLEWLNQTSPATKAAAVAVAGLVAAIGPLLVALGAISSGLGVVAAALGSPLLVPIAAVGAAITGLISLWAAFQDEIALFARVTVRVIQEWARTSGAGFVELANTIKTQLVDRMKSVASFIMEWVKRVAGAFVWVAKKIGVEIVPNLVDIVTEEWGAMGESIERDSEDTAEAATGSFQEMAFGIDNTVASMQAANEFRAITKKMADDAVELKGNVVGEFVGLNEELPMPEIKTTVEVGMAEVVTVMGTKATEATAAVMEKFDKLGIDLPTPIKSIVDSIGDVNNVLNELLSIDVDKTLTDIVSFFRQMKDDLSHIIPAITGIIKKIGGAFSYSAGGQQFNFGGPGGGGMPPGYGGPTVLPGGGFDSAILFQVTDLAKYAVTRNQILAQMDAELGAQTALLRQIAQDASDNPRRPPTSSSTIAGGSLDSVDRGLEIRRQRELLAQGFTS